VTFRVADFLKGLSSSILKICISFVYIKLEGSCQERTKYTWVFQQEIRGQFCQCAAKIFRHFHVVPSALVWQTNQTSLTRSRFKLRTFGNCLPSARTLLLSNFHWDGVSWVFTAKLVMFCLYAKCFLVVVIQHHGILKNAKAAAFSKISIVPVCARGIKLIIAGDAQSNCMLIPYLFGKIH